MTNMEIFKYKVKSLGGVWASDDVYFSQTKDEYQAAYLPEYPQRTQRDMRISDIRHTGAYLRGNYELTRMWGKIRESAER